MMVSRTTPEIMMMDVPPKDTFAPKYPLKKIGINAIIHNPTAPMKMT